jgi:hypothetical protein
MGVKPMTECAELKEKIMEDVKKIEASVNKKLLIALIVLVVFLFLMAIMQSSSGLGKRVDRLGDIINEGINKLCGPVEPEPEAKLEIYCCCKCKKDEKKPHLLCKCDRVAANNEGRQLSETKPAISASIVGHDLVICDIILKNSGRAKVSYPFIKLYLKPDGPNCPKDPLCGVGTADEEEREAGYTYEGYAFPERSWITTIPVGVSIHCPLRFPMPDQSITTLENCQYKARLRLFYGDVSQSFDFSILGKKECEPKGCLRRH